MFKWSRTAFRCVVAVGTLAVVVATGCASGTSTDFPTKPINIVVGSSPGAPIDVMARTLAKPAEKVFGQPVVVLNKTGGSGTVAMGYVLSQPPDGYTVGTEATGITSILQLPNAQFKYTDFAYIIRTQLDPFALFVRKNGKYQSIEDLIKAAKERPGEVTVGGYGTGSPHHIIAVQWAKLAGIKIKWVAFDSGKDALTATLGGHLDATLSNMSLLPGMEEQVLALAHSAEKRMEQFPNVRTFKEQGYDLVRYHWRGIYTRKGVPQAVLQKLHDGFRKAMQSQEWKDYMKSTGMLDGYLSMEQFTAEVDKQAAGDLAVLKEIGLVK